MATTEEHVAMEIIQSNSQRERDTDDIKHMSDENWEELPSFNDLRSKMAEHQHKLKQVQSSFRAKLQDNIDSIWLQTFIVLLVIFDLIIGLTTIIKDEQLERIITLIIIVIYCIEIALRIFAYGFKKYFTSILDIIDFIAVLGSLVLYIFAIYVVYALLVKILRWIRVLRTAYRAIFSRTKKIQRAIRNLQRSNLIGYRDEKYDLDIAYITDHILIMSRPATNTINQFSHDSLNDMKCFLDEKHGNHYRIYDLCVYDDVGQDHDKKKKENKDLNHEKGNSNYNKLDAQSPSDDKPTFSTTTHSYKLDDRESSNLSSSAISIFPVNIDISDGPNDEYNTFGDCIHNEYAFRGSTVLSLGKLFEFAETATEFADQHRNNVIIIQSTSGLGRSMFMCSCLLFYYYPTAKLTEIMKFIHKERIHDHGKEDLNGDGKVDVTDLFCKFLPSQTRYIRYFATLISHCYKLANMDQEIDDEVQELERNLSLHMETIHIHHNQQSLIAGIDSDIIEAFNSISKSKWNFYHNYALDMLGTKIGIVIKSIGIYNYFDEIDPYINWEADIFQWMDDYDHFDNDFRCIEYNTFKYGIDSEPGKNSSLIRRSKDVKPMVLEQDFGIRIYKSEGNREDERVGKRKLMGQLILHSHFINLDDQSSITFKKNEIDFVNKDRNHKHFPEDFNIVITAKILRKKM